MQLTEQVFALILRRNQHGSAQFFHSLSKMQLKEVGFEGETNITGANRREVLAILAGS